MSRSAEHAVPLRRGLPRAVGGDPWPPGGVAGVAGVVHPELPVAATSESVSAVALTDAARPEAGDAEASRLSAPLQVAHAAPVARSFPDGSGVSLRQGLPRIPGGSAWPHRDTLHGVPAATPANTTADTSVVAPADTPSVTASVPQPTHTPEPPVSAAAPATPTDLSKPSFADAQPLSQPAGPKQLNVSNSQPAPAAATAPSAAGAKSVSKLRTAVCAAVGLVAAAAVIVLCARGVTTLPGVPEFMERYPGEYHSRVETDPGFPAWARSTHFLNFFFIALIIRSGLQVRYQQKPPAFYTPKRGGQKVSINLWLHTSLDVLWVANGIVFVTLLFVTGHWARIVPTSWEVFPNALSALLQYLTLEWPVENGWINYNSLQQLMYFTIVFVAAPLAIISGARMSEWWPKRAEQLNRLYPADVARKIHFPVMLFFSLFVIVHVTLVFSTGALRNLNHMFAGTPEISWVGFWWFVAGLAATALIMVLARPMILAPIASLAGKISTR